MNNLRDRLTRCFQTVFPELSESEISQASTASVGNWDSVASLTLLAVVEEEFGITIPAEDIVDLVSFDLLLDYLRGQGHVS